MKLLERSPPPEYLEYRPRRRGKLYVRVRSAVNRLGAVGVAAMTGGYGWLVAPYRLEWPTVEVPLGGLHPSLDGSRIVQLSDLHAGTATPLNFLCRVVDQVNHTPHDAAVITGDFVSHSRKYVAAVAEIVGRLRGPVFAVLGNHDYNASAQPWRSTEIADELQRRMEAHGVKVLRNSAVPFDCHGGRVWIAGVDDYWSGHFSPATAMAQVAGNEPVIALSHNPDSVFGLSEEGADLILCGHTHGGQIRLPVLGRMVLPMKHKKFAAGRFEVGQSLMYVTRGVGFKVPVRFRCPPEIPTFILRCKEACAT